MSSYSECTSISIDGHASEPQQIATGDKLTPKKRENIVIIGGGIIGCTTAYYLTRHPRYDPLLHTVTLLEAVKIGNGASGKAGGLLASWAHPSNIAGLSFDLHDQLANEHNGVELWGHRRVQCGQLTAVGRQQNFSKLGRSNATISLGKLQSDNHKNASVLPDDLDWLNAETAYAYEELADTSSTAQVHPLQFTTCMAKLAEERGASIIMGMVDDIKCIDDHNASGVPESLTTIQSLAQKKVVSVTYTDKSTSEIHTILTTTVVLAAGPWTSSLFPKVRMTPLRAHSVTIKLKIPVSAYCLFTNITLSESSQLSINPDLSQPSSSTTISIEIYARPNGEVYICSQGDFDTSLPPPTHSAKVSLQSCQEIIDAAISVSDKLQQGQVTSRRACYLPIIDVGSRNHPLIGQTGLEGLFLATGHSCWGILNAPATGKIISEFIFDGRASCAEIGDLDPRKIL